MMMGTAPFRRSDRVTSRPSSPGSPRSSTTRSGRWVAAVRSAAGPAPTAVATAHHLTHRITAPATLATKDRQAEPEPAQHRQLPVPIFRAVVHLVLLLRIQSVRPYPGPHL